MEDVAFELSPEAEKEEKIKSNQRKEHRPVVPKLCVGAPWGATANKIFHRSIVESFKF